MKFQTMSLLAGNHICNAACPFCVSRMTNPNGNDQPVQDINRRNLLKAIQIAMRCDITSVLITGKGEPTLYPDHITEYLQALNFEGTFPFIELQTNGWMMELDGDVLKTTYPVPELLKRWYNLGLTTVMISNVGFDMELNRQIYFPKRKKYIDLEKVIDRIHEAGLIVRYTTVGIQGGIDTPAKFDKLTAFCGKMGIEQLTWRPVAKTTEDNSVDPSVNQWVRKHGLIDILHSRSIREHVKKHGTKLYDLVHGASVFDFRGQNVCISTCLTHDPEEDTIRQLIFHPDGKLFTDWQFKGSRLL